MPKSILLIGPPGSGKTVSLETLPGGTVDINFDPGGWKSLDRPLVTDPVTIELLRSGKKLGRIPKKLRFAAEESKDDPTLKGWLSHKEHHLERDEILIVDYQPTTNKIQLSKAPLYATDTFIKSSTDINILSEPIAKGRGICHVAGDSLTWWQWAVLEAIVIFRGSTASGYLGPDQDVYGKAIEKMKEIIDTCCHIPFDFILTAHIQSDKDDKIGRIKEEIAIYGKKLPEIIASAIDDIYFCADQGGGKYTWSAHSQDFLKAMRTRNFDYLPITFDANFTKLYGDRLYHE